MANLTISLDDVIVRNARIRAIQEGTSVSAKVREFLRAYVEGADVSQMQSRQLATSRLLQIMTNVRQSSQSIAPAATTNGTDGTLRAALYADDFRQLARDAALAAPAVPVADDPGA